MIVRPFTLITGMMFVLSGAYLFVVKHHSEVLDDQLTQVTQATRQDEQSIRVLQAQWALEADPSRAGLAGGAVHRAAADEAGAADDAGQPGQQRCRRRAASRRERTRLTRCPPCRSWHRRRLLRSRLRAASASQAQARPRPRPRRRWPRPPPRQYQASAQPGRAGAAGFRQRGCALPHPRRGLRSPGTRSSCAWPAPRTWRTTPSHRPGHVLHEENASALYVAAAAPVPRAQPMGAQVMSVRAVASAAPAPMPIDDGGSMLGMAQGGTN